MDRKYKHLCAKALFIHVSEKFLVWDYFWINNAESIHLLHMCVCVCACTCVCVCMCVCANVLMCVCLMTWIRLARMLYFFTVTHKTASQTLSKAFLKSMKRGRSLASAGDISHKGFLGWRSALWCSDFSQRILRLKICSVVLWGLPVLQQWTPLLAVSVCSVWSSAWLCLGGWWDWSFVGFGIAAGCISWEV